MKEQKLEIGSLLKADNFNLFQLSTGEFLRKEITSNSEIGKKITSIMNSGSLVSDEIVSDLIEKIVSNKIYYNRIIFDGYPRSLNQAKNLDRLLIKYKQKIDIVLKLSVSLDTVKKRILERRNLEKRSDDSEDIAIKRYNTYEINSKPVIDFYKHSGLLRVVNGERSITEINSEISALIEAI